jgi:antitoxin CcdA
MRIICASEEAQAVGHDRGAAKRPVNMTLNEDLVRRARNITPNLSETVESLLTAFVDDAEASATRRERQIAAHIAASNAFVAKHGTLADDFDNL